MSHFNMSSHYANQTSFKPGDRPETRKYNHEKILELYKTKTGSEVANIIGCSTVTVHKIASKYGVTRHGTLSFLRSRKGILNANWKGGHGRHWNGYVHYETVYMPDHPLACFGYVKKHIQVYEQFYNVRIKKGQIIHHIDKNPLNNDPSNLQLLDNQSQHAKLHGHLKKLQNEKPIEQIGSK